MKMKIVGAAFAVLLCMTACKTTSRTSLGQVDEKETIAVLAGRWDILKVNGEDVPVSTEIQKGPFLEFNLAEKRIHGNTGCNILNGSYSQKEGQGNSMIPGQLMSTRMACPDMNTERKVLEALQQVVSFEKVSRNEVALCNANGRQVILMKKK